MSASDRELIQEIQQHDKKAFDVLFSRYKNHVYRFLIFLTKNDEEVEDLFQETWLRAVKSIQSNHEIENFKAWILTIAANLYKDTLRKKKFRRLMFFTQQKDQQFEDQIISRMAVVENESFKVDFTLALKWAIKKMPHKQRKVFILKEIEGFKHTEIVEFLNIPIGTVKSLLYRANKFLQAELADFQVK